MYLILFFAKIMNTIRYFSRMESSGMLRRVALVRTDVSEELGNSIIRVTRIGDIGRNTSISSQRASVASYGYVPTSPILVTLMMEGPSSSETSILTTATRRNIPEDAILHSQLKSYIDIYPSLVTVLSFRLVA
jgi:hypothetical protein